eukprot:333977-Karenia_brevis.AAC.1
MRAAVPGSLDASPRTTWSGTVSAALASHSNTGCVGSPPAAAQISGTFKADDFCQRTTLGWTCLAPLGQSVVPNGRLHWPSL